MKAAIVLGLIAVLVSGALADLQGASAEGLGNQKVTLLQSQEGNKDSSNAFKFQVDLRDLQGPPPQPDFFPPIDLVENKKVDVLLTPGENVTYKYQKSLPFEIPEIVLFFEPKDKRKALDDFFVYLATNTSNPHEGNSEHSCSPRRFEPCVFRPPMFNKTGSISTYIQFICVDNELCEVDFTILHTDEMHLKPNKPISFTFARMNVEAFNFTIPAQSDFSRLVLSIHLLNKHPSQFNFGFYTKLKFLGNFQPIVRELTDRVYAIFNNTHDMCYNCNVTVIVTSPQGTVFNIELLQYSPSTLLLKDHEYVDHINVGTINLYEFTLTNEEKDPDLLIFFSLDSLTGNAKKMYVNADSQPGNLSGYFWSARTDENQYNEEYDIVLSQFELSTLHASGKQFYIAVTSENSGSYVLRLKVQKDRLIPLHIGVTDFDTLNNLDLQNYELEIFEDESDGYDRKNLTVTASIERGNIDIFARFCRLKDNDCLPITKEETMMPNTNLIFDYHAVSEGKDRISFSPRCPASNSRHCFLNIAVRGGSNTHDSNKYGITARRDEHILHLLENKAYESHITKDTVQIFKFYLEDERKDALSLKVTINADLEFYGAKHDFCFDRSLPCSLEHTIEGSKTLPLVWKKNGSSSLEDAYYFFVVATKTTNFQIYAEVKRAFNNTPIIPKISDGKLSQGHLSKDSPSAYFKFEVDLQEMSDVEIFLQGDVGKFRMYVSNDDYSLPSKEKYYWTSHNNFIYISKNDEMYRHKDVYNILIVPESLKDIDDKVISFGITYATKHSIKIIENNEPFYDSINGNETKSYIFFAHPEEGRLILTKDVLSPPGHDDDLHISVSLGLDAPFVLTSKDKQTSSVILNKENLIDICGEKQQRCPLYLKVSTSNTTRASTVFSYSLRVFLEAFSIHIIDGLEQEFPFNNDIDTLHMYYEPFTLNNSVDIFMYTFNSKFNLIISIFNNKNHTFRSNYPQIGDANNSLIYALPPQDKHTFTINPTGLKWCWPNCLILMTAVLEKTNALRNRSEDLQAVYNEEIIDVLVSSQMTRINPNHPVMFTLIKDEWQYFRYDLKDISEALTFTLTSFHGDAEIYAQILDNRANTLRPNDDDWDFMDELGFLTINKGEIEGAIVNKNLNRHNLTLVIGVVSDSKEEQQFTLNFYTASYPVINILRGEPVNIYLNGSKSVYLIYHNYKNGGLKFLFNREGGVGFMSVTGCQNGRNLSQCMETPDHTQRLTGGTSGVYYLGRGNYGYCSGCTYLIKLESISKLAGSMTVIYEEETLSLMERSLVYDFTVPRKFNFYAFKINISQAFEINFNVQSGNPTFYINFRWETSVDDFDLKYEVNDSTSKMISLDIPARTSPEFGAMFPKLGFIDTSNDPENISEIGKNIPHHYSIYIAVKDDHPMGSNYSLVYKLAQHEYFLSSGALMFSDLLPQENKTYSYHYDDVNSEPSLNIHLYKGNITNLTVSIYFTPHALKSQKYRQSGERTLLTLNYSTAFEESLTYLLPPRKLGYYDIVMINEATAENKNEIPNLTLDFSILVSYKDVTLVPHDYSLHGSLKKNEWRFYEMFIPHDGVLAIELFECLGDINLKLTNSYHNLLDHDFDYLLEKSLGHHYVNLVRLKKGMSYLALSSPERESIYRLTSHLYDTYEDVPASKVSAKSTSEITWSFDRGTGKFVFILDPVQCRKCSQAELNDVSVQYRLMISDNATGLINYGNCGYFSSENQKDSFSEIIAYEEQISKAEEARHFIRIETSLPLGKVHYVSVKAQVRGLKDSKSPVLVFFDKVEIYQSATYSNTEAFLTWMFLIALGLFAVALGGCLIYYKKFRKADKILTYEMQDIKNAVQFSGMNLSVSEDTQQSIENKRVYVGIEEDRV